MSAFQHYDICSRVKVLSIIHFSPLATFVDNREQPLSHLTTTALSTIIALNFCVLKLDRKKEAKEHG
jgi:hypothetical protein